MRTICGNCREIIDFRKISDLIKTHRSYCSDECKHEYAYRRKKTLLVNATCLNCGKEFHRKESQLKKYKQHFCCWECSRAYRKKDQVAVQCETCGKTKWVKKYTFDININKRFFCNRGCMKEFSKNYLRDILERKQAAHNYKRSVDYCEVCGWDENPAILSIWWRDGDHKNRADDNMVVVCKNCFHGIWLGYIKRY